MQFVLSTFGSSGDVFPMVGLALELRRRGHDVTFATNAHYAKLAQHYDLPFEPLGSEADFQACIRHPDLWHPRRSFAHVFSALRPALRRHYDIHAERAARGTVVAINQCFGFGALLAQDKLGVPVITLHVQPAVLWSDVDPPTLAGVVGPRWLKSLLYRVGERFFIDPVVCPFLNAWRAELGLAPVQGITRWWNSRFGVLCMFPEWYAKPQADWPTPLLQTDFPLWNHQPREGMPAEVEAFLGHGDAPLVFTPGSTNVHGRAFFTAALEACQALGRRGLFLTEFPEQLPRPLPASVAHVDYVPLERMLPRSAGFVHHGGIGSTSQGLAAGVPQVLMPLAHDQFDNAQRLQRLGVGVSIPASKFTGSRLTAALRGLLDQPTTRQACTVAAERLRVKDGLRRSADAIEAHVARRN